MEPELMYSLITIAVALGVGTFAWYKGKKKEVLRMIDYLVQVAEDKFGDGKGTIKYQYVIEKVYPLLPKVMKFAITEEQLDKWITESVDNLQEKIKTEIEK